MSATPQIASDYGMASLKRIIGKSVTSAAAALVGCILVRRFPGGKCIRALIVETEAYHQCEPGCHAYRGQTPRNAPLFGPPGRLYVYFTYGMWHCANIVCEPEGTAAGVLLRAAMPLAKRKAANYGEPLPAKCPSKPRLSGPGLLCRGLELDRSFNGRQVLARRGDIWVYRPRCWQPVPLSWGRRIGLGVEERLPWRCCWTGHPCLSKPCPGLQD
jgi:DNA-3-methyladenine glycosylase